MDGESGSWTTSHHYARSRRRRWPAMRCFSKPGRSSSASAQGGWANGDAAFVGPNPPDDAVITYYQKKRHIFGDLKIEVFDQAGKLVGTVPSSKRRGLSRVTWSMRITAPRVPPAASAAFGAAFG